MPTPTVYSPKASPAQAVQPGGIYVPAAGLSLPDTNPLLTRFVGGVLKSDNPAE